MCKLFKRKKTSKSKQQPTIVKAEIDYDKLADKLAQAMVKYQEKNAITSETITEALENYDTQKAVKESKEVKTGSLFVMRVLLLGAYIIAAVLVTLFGASLCYEYSKHNSLEDAFSIPFIFWGVAVIFIIFGVSAFLAKKKDEIERHFTIFTTLISLLLATLALFFPKDNSKKTMKNDMEQTTISQEYEVAKE